MIGAVGEEHHLDHDYIEELMSRLGDIPPGRKPLWGQMNKQRLIAHLVWYVKYSLGRVPEGPPVFHLARPLLRIYYLALPLRWPRHLACPDGGTQGLLAGAGDLEELEALLEDYVGEVQADTYSPPPHPVFGIIGIDGWDRFHVRHFEHHLRQFGA